MTLAEIHAELADERRYRFERNEDFDCPEIRALEAKLAALTPVHVFSEAPPVPPPPPPPPPPEPMPVLINVRAGTGGVYDPRRKP
jgi:hypothetical protein